jgi:hypothetical protein
MNDEDLVDPSKQYLPWKATKLEYEPAVLHHYLHSAWFDLEQYRQLGIIELTGQGDINKLKMFLNRVSAHMNGIENMLYVLKRISLTGEFEQHQDKAIKNKKAKRTEYKEDSYPVDF